MINIKYFNYKNLYEFKKCLNSYGYRLRDAVGFNVSGIQRYRGNILKTYIIYVNDGKSIYFNVAYFKSLNEYDQCYAGLKGERLLKWCDDKNVREYKVKDIWGKDDWYVIAM